MRVRFEINVETAFGERVSVVGSSPALGDWNVVQCPTLSTDSDRYPSWRTQWITVDHGEEFKFVKIRGDDTVQWEPGQNRVIPKLDKGDHALKCGDFGIIETIEIVSHQVERIESSAVICEKPPSTPSVEHMIEETCTTVPASSVSCTAEIDMLEEEHGSVGIIKDHAELEFCSEQNIEWEKNKEAEFTDHLDIPVAVVEPEEVLPGDLHVVVPNDTVEILEPESDVLSHSTVEDECTDNKVNEVVVPFDSRDLEPSVSSDVMVDNDLCDEPDSMKVLAFIPSPTPTDGLHVPVESCTSPGDPVTSFNKDESDQVLSRPPSLFDCCPHSIECHDDPSNMTLRAPSYYDLPSEFHPPFTSMSDLMMDDDSSTSTSEIKPRGFYHALLSTSADDEELEDDVPCALSGRDTTRREYNSLRRTLTSWYATCCGRILDTPPESPRPKK